MRTLRSLLAPLALAALLGHAGASSSEGAPRSGSLLTGGSPAAPPMVEVSATVPVGAPGLLPDAGAGPRLAGRSAATPAPALGRPYRPTSLPTAEERLAPALGREGHPSTAPPRSR